MGRPSKPTELKSDGERWKATSEQELVDGAKEACIESSKVDPAALHRGQWLMLSDMSTLPGRHYSERRIKGRV